MLRIQNHSNYYLHFECAERQLYMYAHSNLLYTHLIYWEKQTVSS
jgi:hypothetical protein